VRDLWRFRAPTAEDLATLRAAEEELARRLPQWQARGLVLDEEIPEGDKTREPRNAGFRFWRDLFLPRQLLTNLVILEEIRAAQERVRAELPADQAEAVAVYLALVFDKVISYNSAQCSVLSAQCSWHDSRLAVRGTFMGHDFRFHAGSAEMEGVRETVMWAANQVIDSYAALCALIHGGEIDLAANDEALGDEEDRAAAAQIEDDESDADEADGDEVSMAHSHAAGNGELRPEVIVPTVTCEDAAARRHRRRGACT
jgi:adenine-specific DNA methylase